MAYDLRTVHGYDFYQVSSCLQKSIRRADARLAGYMALELWRSGYVGYLWKRLFTISAEDCWGILTKEIESLWQGYQLVNNNAKEPKGRIFISKAVLLLCAAKKSRDADHLSNFVYDKMNGLTPEQLDKEISECTEYVRLPNYVYDVHTLQGKKMGKTKEQFFKEEYEALQPKQPGLFDDIIISNPVQQDADKEPFLFDIY